MIDYYNLLEIPPGASQGQIKKAFRRLAKQVHPDANPGSTAEERDVLRKRFIQLAQAYDVLSDPARREQYRRQWRAHPHQPPGESGRSARSGSAGPFRRSSAAFGGARRDPGGDSQHRKRPNGKPGFDFPEDLLDDVKNLLAGFGLHLKQPLEMLLERLTAWAREIFQGVAGETEQGAGHDTPRKPPRGGKTAGTNTAGTKTAGTRKTGAAAQQKQDDAKPELDAELAALKKRARKGRTRKASGDQETEEELRRLKASAASRKSRRE
ncbi:MAG: J domain-containing protein [bacterium]